MRYSYTMNNDDLPFTISTGKYTNLYLRASIANDLADLLEKAADSLPYVDKVMAGIHIKMLRGAVDNSVDN